MDCLYCSYTDIYESAVAVCRCGAGICRRHAFEHLGSPPKVVTIGPVGRATPRTERQILCPACSARGAGAPRRVSDLAA